MAAARRNAFIRGFGGLFSWVDVLNRRLLPDSSPEFHGELLLPTPDMLRDSEDAIPGSANHLLTLAEQEHKARIKYEYLGLISSFVAMLALVAISAVVVSLGFEWLSLGIIGGGVSVMAGAFIYSDRAKR